METKPLKLLKEIQVPLLPLQQYSSYILGFVPCSLHLHDKNRIKFMDLDEFRSFISDSGVDIWTWIDMSISVASADHEDELKNRRDAIVQKLYTPNCHNCRRIKIETNEDYHQKQDVAFEEMQLVQESVNDDEQRRILEIKIRLDDHNQSERSLVDLLQRLVDMDTTFIALKETDIGRHVSKLRKHSSNEVRRLVKILVRKWKETVDEWVRVNTRMEEEAATQLNGFPELVE